MAEDDFVEYWKWAFILFGFGVVGSILDMLFLGFMKGIGFPIPFITGFPTPTESFEGYAISLTVLVVDLFALFGLVALVDKISEWI